MSVGGKNSSDGSSLRIALLAHGLRVAGGVTVGKGLLAALARVAPQYEYYVTIPPGHGYEEICQVFPHCQVFTYQHRENLFSRLRDERHVIAAKVRAFKPDLVWALGNVGLPRLDCSQALLLHNPHRVYPLRHAGPIGIQARIIRRMRDYHLKKSLPEIDMVLCQTETMRHRFVDRYDYRGRTALCPNAGALKEMTPGTVSRPDIFTGLAGKFVLFCLTKYYPHKNLEGIIDAFSRYREELRDCAVLLTIAPDQGKGAQRILHAIKGERLEDNIINLGQVSPRELPGYYQHCQGLILPTLLESFSGTYIEAMQFSCPILTSDLDFAREVCGEAALYFDPWNPKAIRDAILRLKNEPALSQKLIRSSGIQLEQFPRSWDEIVLTAMGQLQGLGGKRK